MALDEPALDPLIGQLVGERYRVLDLIGRGGMGAVYRVEHTMMKKEMALKLLHPELGRLDELARRFEREAEAAAKLDHPNIIHVTDFGRTADGMLFLVMELLHGVALADVVRPDGEHGQPLEVGRAVAILRQILRALEHAHAVGIVHRDLKPDNVMLIERDGERDIVKLLDFGIAKMKVPEVQHQKGQTLTQAGMVFGTPEYLSPEQAMGEEADQRADLYSAGVVLYELLAGRRPFEAASKLAVVSMHITQKALPVTAAAPAANIPSWLERVVEQAMAKKREERFASAHEMLHALDAGELGRPPSTSQPIAVGRPELVPPWLRVAGERVLAVWPWLVGRARDAGVPFPRAFAAAGLGLVAALVLLLGLGHKSEAPKRPPAELADRLARAESLLAHGELEPARAVLQQLMATHPETARVHYLFGNLDYAQGERERALGDYRRAIELDRGYRSDAVLRNNARALLDRRAEGLEAVALLAEAVGAPALADLNACARTCRDERVRRRAAEAAAKLGGPPVDKEPEEDAHQAALDKLRAGRNCRERKAAALELIASGDRRYADALRTARERRGGLFGLEQVNACMRRDLDAALRKLEADK